MSLEQLALAYAVEDTRNQVRITKNEVRIVLRFFDNIILATYCIFQVSTELLSPIASENNHLKGLLQQPTSIAQKKDLVNQ